MSSTKTRRYGLVAALVVAAASVLVVAAAVAVFDRASGTYEPADVVRAFRTQGLVLAEPRQEGWTAYGPRLSPSEALLLPEPTSSARFYVYVAASDAIARNQFRVLTRLGRTPDVFDLIRGNVLVSSDSSFTDHGLSSGEKQRLRAAMSALGRDS